MQRYDTVIFDLYGTLVDIHTEENAIETWNAFAAWLDQQGIRYSGKRAKHIFDRKMKKTARQKSEFTYPEWDVLPAFAALIRKKCRHASDDFVWQAGETFRRIALKRLQLYKNTVYVLETLRQKGIRCILLSNAQLVYTQQEIRQLALDKYFDDIYISSVAGCMKPEAAFFLQAIREHELDISRTLMVGNDAKSDMQGAKNVGMDCVFLKTDDRTEPLPDCTYVYPDGNIAHVL